MEDARKELLKAIGPDILERIQQAVKSDKIGLMVVLTDEILKDLTEGKVASAALEDGGVIVLIPPQLVRRIYPQEGDKKDGKNHPSPGEAEAATPGPTD